MTTFFNILPPHILGALVLVFAVGHQKQLRDQCLFLISWVVHVILRIPYPMPWKLSKNAHVSVDISLLPVSYQA